MFEISGKFKIVHNLWEIEIGGKFKIVHSFWEFKIGKLAGNSKLFIIFGEFEIGGKFKIDKFLRIWEIYISFHFFGLFVYFKNIQNWQENL